MVVGGRRLLWSFALYEYDDGMWVERVEGGGVMVVVGDFCGPANIKAPLCKTN